MGHSLRLGSCALAVVGIFLNGCNRKSGPSKSDPPPASHLPAVHAADPPADPLADPNVLTFHNDNMRSGQNLNEGNLTPANVNSAGFGKVAFLRVQGKVDAQPLYVSKLTVAGRKRNVVFVVTEHDLAYAFDADTFAQLWRVSLLAPGETPSDKRDCEQIEPEIGITSTPVIDRNAGPHGTMYVVAMSKDSRDDYFHRLHALDLTTGADEHPPQIITASFPGSGPNSNQGRVTFDAKQYEDRAALLLSSGIIFTTWASHCDHEPYNGWVIAFRASTLKRVSALNLTPNGTEGSIWMTGNGPASDEAGNIYLLNGNGTFDSSLDSHGFPVDDDFGNSFLRLDSEGNRLGVYDYFTMHNTAAESNGDEDLGSGGVLLLPDVSDASGKLRHLAVGAGKDQVIYVVDRDAMGKFNPNNDNAIHQALPNALGGAEFASPAYFNGSVYYGAYLAPLKAFPITNALLASSPSSQTANRFDYPGTTPSISARGSSNAIVWAVEDVNTRGVLHAFDATNLASELYNSNQAANGRDHFSDNKFITPMIAGGKVFVGTQSGVAVFGLLP
jgi:outer membrane protein assembly factor BamB